MAYNANNIAKLGDLKEMATRFIAALAPTFKSAEISDNTIKFYTSADKSGTPAFSLDLPTADFLDSAETSFVAEFVFSTETYPNATNPNLDGKPVLVLAAKSSNNTTSYSFVSLEALANVGVTIENATDGDFAGIDAAGKLIDSGFSASDFIGKVNGAVENNFAIFDADGKIKDSTVKIASDAEVAEMLNEVGLTAAV